MTTIGPGNHPVLSEFRSRLQGDASLKQNLEQQVQARIQTGGTAGVLDSTEYTQLQAEFLQKLGVSDPAQATPEQLQAVQNLMADALDGSLDGQNQLTESETVVSTLARGAQESSDFDPVGFQIQMPAQPTGSTAASLPVGRMRATQLSQTGMIQNLYAADKATLADKMLDRLLSRPQSVPASEMNELLSLVKERRTQELGKVREAAQSQARALLQKAQIPQASRDILQRSLSALEASPQDSSALETLAQQVDQLGTDPARPLGAELPAAAAEGQNPLTAVAARLASAETPADQKQALLADILRQLDPARAEDSKQGELLALALVHGSADQQKQAIDRLLRPHDGNAQALTRLYQAAAQGAQNLRLDKSVMPILATQHFATLSGSQANQVRFDILMKIQDNSPPEADLRTPPHQLATLRPLLQALRDRRGPDGNPDPRGKDDLRAIRALASGLVSQYAQQQSDAIQNNTGTVIGGVTFGGGSNPGSVTHSRISEADFARANRIIKIIDWLLQEENGTATPPPANTERPPVSPPVQTGPEVTEEPVAPAAGPPSEEPEVEEPPAAPVEAPPPPDFSTQNFLERMQRYRENRDLEALLKDLNAEDQVKLVRLLDETADGDFRKPDGTSERLAVPSREQARQTLEALMPRLHSLPAAQRGEMAAQLLDQGTRPDLAFSLIRQAHEQGELPALMAHLRKDGRDLSAEIPRQLSNEEAGKVLAWMVTDEGSERSNASQISQQIRELSQYWVQDDNITRSFMRELQDFAGRPGQETRGLGIIKDHLGQDLVRQLTQNLDRGWVTPQDREFMLKLSAAAGTQLGNQQVQQLLNLGDHRNALKIMARSSDQDLAAILSSADQQRLQAAFNSNPAAFAENLERLERGSGQLATGDRAALQSQLNQLIQGMPIDRLRQSWNTLARDSRLELGDATREALLSRFAQAGDFEATKTLLRGGMGLEPAAGASRSRMLDTLSAQITRTRDVQRAGEALSWVLESGSRAQIERAFRNVNLDSWFGPRKGEIVNAAMTQGRDYLRGKLSLDTIQYMAGALNNFSAKVGARAPQFVRESLGLGDFNRNVQNIRALAELGSRDAKAAIMRDLMDYWTPAQSETLIHDILRDAGQRPGELRGLVDALGTAELNGAQRLSDELEDRGELGRIMATILENYGPGADQALNDIMGRWSSTSIKSDDFIHNMLKALEPDAAKKLAARLRPETLRTLIDWTNDAFRDGNIRDLDAESQWSIQVLEAALRLKGK